MAHPLKPTVQITWEKCKTKDFTRTLFTVMRTCSIYARPKDIQTAVKCFSTLGYAQAAKDILAAKEAHEQWIIDSLQVGAGKFTG